MNSSMGSTERPSELDPILTALGSGNTVEDKVNYFKALPRDVQLLIFDLLSAKDLGRSGIVSKSWKALTEDPAFLERINFEKVKSSTPIEINTLKPSEAASKILQKGHVLVVGNSQDQIKYTNPRRYDFRFVKLNPNLTQITEGDSINGCLTTTNRTTGEVTKHPLQGGPRASAVNAINPKSGLCAGTLNYFSENIDVVDAEGKLKYRLDQNPDKSDEGFLWDRQGLGLSFQNETLAAAFSGKRKIFDESDSSTDKERKWKEFKAQCNPPEDGSFFRGEFRRGDDSLWKEINFIRTYSMKSGDTLETKYFDKRISHLTSNDKFIVVGLEGYLDFDEKERDTEILLIDPKNPSEDRRLSLPYTEEERGGRYSISIVNLEVSDKFAVAQCSNKKTYIWNVNDGRLLSTITDVSTNKVACDGDYVAVPKEAGIEIWNAIKDKSLGIIPIGNIQVDALQYKHGEYLLIASRQSYYLWQPQVKGSKQKTDAVFTEKLKAPA